MKDSKIQEILKEFGWGLVPLDQAGSPTPGRVADRLYDLCGELFSAIGAGVWGNVIDVHGALMRLSLSLTAWEAQMVAQLCQQRRAAGQQQPEVFRPTQRPDEIGGHHDR